MAVTRRFFLKSSGVALASFAAVPSFLKRTAFAQSVASPDNPRSLFDAQDYMEPATPGNRGTGDGWLTRYMQAKKAPKAPLSRGVSFTANCPRTMLGPAPAIAMTNIADFGVRAG